MNSLTITLNRFLKNKNTVTIIGIIAVVGLLYWGYTSTLNNAVKPVSVPVAAETIQPRTKITSDMINTINVSNVAINENVIRSQSSIVGKYTNIASIIPKGSMFYSEMLVTEDELPDAAFIKVKAGEVPYNFPVNMETTYGNSIYPGNKIDIYMKAQDTNGQIMIGKLIENIEVLAVKDANGRHVFENSDEARVPAYLIFGVSDEINILLRKASYMNSFSVELLPVPHGGTVDTTGNTQVSTQYLKDFINANTVTIKDESKETTTEKENTTSTSNTKNNTNTKKSTTTNSTGTTTNR